MDLQLKEIFLSLEGETTDAGFPALFIRLAGCNLSCSWCDTRDSWEGGVPVPLGDILDVVTEYSWVHHVTVTGGEPLAQKGAVLLLEKIAARDIPVQLETNGSLDLSEVPSRVRKIVDVKPPSSGHENSFLETNLARLGAGDEIKIVVADENDLAFAADFFERFGSFLPCVVNLSPCGDLMSGEGVASFILENRLAARLNLQLHKIIWREKGEPVHNLIPGVAMKKGTGKP